LWYEAVQVKELEGLTRAETLATDEYFSLKVVSMKEGKMCANYLKKLSLLLLVGVAMCVLGAVKSVEAYLSSPNSVEKLVQNSEVICKGEVTSPTLSRSNICRVWIESDEKGERMDIRF
jgi:hypothetical protein